MPKKEVFDLVAGYINKGLSAGDIRKNAAKYIDEKTLEILWSIPRENINNFVVNSLSDLVLEPPFLDLGCGRRSFKSEILQKYGEQTVFVGIDHYLPTERTNCLQRLPDVVAQAEYLPLPDDSIGTIFCMELLEHVPDEQKVVGEISRVLRLNGHLLLSVPGLDIPKHEKLPFQQDYRRMSAEQVLTLLKVHGFRNIKIDVNMLEGFQTNIFVTARK